MGSYEVLLIVGMAGEEEDALFELTPTDTLGDINEIGNDGKKGNDLKIFAFATISAATNNFSSVNKLGQGGFGPVFKVN